MGTEIVESWLRSVPMAETLAVRVTEMGPGHLALQTDGPGALRMHGGSHANAALTALAELAASAVVATHPVLGKAHPRLRAASIVHHAAGHEAVSASAVVDLGVVHAVRTARSGTAVDAEIRVELVEASGRRLAEWSGQYRFGLPSPTAGDAR